jgi:peptidyl-prolyl cis-trans isomerase C
MTRRFPGVAITLSALCALGLLGCLTPEVDGPPGPPVFDPSEDPAPLGAPQEPLAAPAARPQPLTPAPAPPVAAAAPDEKAAPVLPAKTLDEEAPLGWIANQPLEAEEFLVEWTDVASREFFLVLDKLVATRLALAEASRLGIRLEPQAVEARYAAARAELDQLVAKEGKARTTQEFIARELGFEPARYLERVRRSTIRQMLAERAVRAGSLASETAAVRMIVVKGEEALAAVQAALAEGRDFAEVAREHSIDETKERGGLVPFVVRQERSPLARLAFETPVGAVGGPVQLDQHSFLLKVEERREPIEGDWAALGATIEASLAEHPVQDSEFVHWKVVMEKRYPIDLGPLWSLVGAAR